MKNISIDKCPKHGWYAVCINDSSTGSGIRITPSKCCGAWAVVKSWEMSSRQWRELAEQANAIADELDKDLEDYE